VTETGAPAGNSLAWTHTLANGTPGGSQDLHCQEWTNSSSTQGGDVGRRTATDSEWTVLTTAGCDEFAAVNLYCFEQG
jgi:hypothetical protein